MSVKGTITPVTFGGKKSVTIAPGQEIWSDGVTLSWVRERDDPAVAGPQLWPSAIRSKATAAR